MFFLGIIAFVSVFYMIGVFSYLFADRPELQLEGLTEEQQDDVLYEEENRIRLLWRSGYIAIAIFVVAIVGIFLKAFHLI